MKNLKFFYYNLIIVTLFFLLLELSLRFYFNQTKPYSCYKPLSGIMKYKNNKNCSYEEKYFEKKNSTFYYTNKNGERSPGFADNKVYNKKILFIGDSFTFGYLSNYNDTYPYNAIKNINNKLEVKYQAINLGVNGYQFDQILHLIDNDKVITDNNHIIVYGLTANDLFDIGELNSQNIKRSFIDRLRSIINKMNLLSIKFIASKILKNDYMYLSIHNKRGSKAGYIQKESSREWDRKYLYFEKKIKEIPDSIKKRLVLTIIPQQVQIRLIKNNLIDEGIAFDSRILSICKKVKIKCISKTSQLAEKLKYETHFVLDGHLYPKANAEYGKMLGNELTKIIKNEK